MRIVHITAHMGAGAGKAISGLAISDKCYQHSIILLQEPNKIEHIDRCVKHGIKVLITPKDELFESEISGADVVVINWWHHPIVYEALMKISVMDTRVLLWSHVNGLNYPKLNIDFLRVFDACLFTTKASLENVYLSMDSHKEIKEKSALVYGMGDFVPCLFPKKECYALCEKIIIGYVGTLDYAKIHPDFVKWIKNVSEIDDRIQFEIAGDCLPEILEDIMKADLSDHVDILGFRKDIPELLKTFDLFMYPLNECNFATTENALLEAMAAGLPIIASNGIIENTIIENGKNGILVSNEDEFAEKLIELLQSEEQRKMLGMNARKAVVSTYDVNINLSKFHKMIEYVMKKNKELHRFNEVVGRCAFDWFLNGCGEKEKEIFTRAIVNDRDTLEYDEYLKKISALKQIYKGKSKGSALQFFNLYPTDEKLEKIVMMMDMVKENKA